MEYATDRDYMQGVVILETYLTPKQVRKIHDKDHYIGVYKARSEDFKLWEKVFSFEIDFFFSDLPVMAMFARDNLK